MYLLYLLLICGLHFQVYSEDLVERHMKERNELLEKEFQMMLGSDIVLSDNEEKVNKMIMDLKSKITDDGFANPQYYNFSKHFFTYKDEVKKTTLYKILKDMPKGGLLHAHDSGLINPDYLINITYWNNLYVCFAEDKVNFLFSNSLPREACATKWELMRNARYASGNVEKFDADLRKHFTIVTDNPNEVYTDVNTVWRKFQGFFIVTTPLLAYIPAWEYYIYETLKVFRAENVMYIEIRSVLPRLYDLEGNYYDSVFTAQSYKKKIDEFIKDYPDFIGVKLIYAPQRLVDGNTIIKYLQIAREIKEKIPGFLAGFDLVGQEDLGKPTKEFLAQLTEASAEFEFFFHAGETNWYGTTSDENLLDAIVLDSRRLGHAYALIKHPVLMDEVRKRDIAVEVNVVSNAVLCLVSDIRNHPLATFLARGLPVVISSDDPGVWEADPLTHDYFVAFVGVASRHADLRVLKKLTLNSLYYSTVANKDMVMREFEIRWTKFIDNLVNDPIKIG